MCGTLLYRLSKGKFNPIHAMEAYEGVVVNLKLIFNFGTKWGYVRFTPQRFYFQGEKPGTHSTGG